MCVEDECLFVAVKRCLLVGLFVLIYAFAYKGVCMIRCEHHSMCMLICL